jgi:hypothetical protein
VRAFARGGRKPGVAANQVPELTPGIRDWRHLNPTQHGPELCRSYAIAFPASTTNHACSTHSSMATKTTRLSSWLAQLVSSPDHSAQKSPRRKRKRAGSEPCPIATHLPPSPIHSSTPTPTPGVVMSTAGNQSPSKRARTDDEVLPEQSISVVSHPLTLALRNTLSLPTSQASKSRRSSSPSRETEANLRFANPPIRTEPWNGVRDPIPQRVRDVMDRLEPDNVERWVPGEKTRKLDKALGVGVRLDDQ